MNLYFLLFGVFLLQEPVSTSAVLIEAYHLGYNVWTIHLLFIIATCVDICVGYALGTWCKNKFANSRFAKWAEHLREIMVKRIGAQSPKLLLFFGGPLIFPLSPFVAPWLDVSFFDALLYLFLGELIFWYAGEWLVVLGVHLLNIPPLYAIGAGALLVALISVGIQQLYKK